MTSFLYKSFQVQVMASSFIRLNILLIIIINSAYMSTSVYQRRTKITFNCFFAASIHQSAEHAYWTKTVRSRTRRLQSNWKLKGAGKSQKVRSEWWWGAPRSMYKIFSKAWLTLQMHRARFQGTEQKTTAGWLKELIRDLAAAWC